MSFGLLKHFKDLKKEGHESRQITFATHLILGHDLGAVLRLLEVRRKFPDQSVKLISVRPVTREALVVNAELGVTLLRSASAVEGIYKKHFNAQILPQNSHPCFYKDGKFHDFGGRAKSMDILDGESFFTHNGYKLRLESLFSPEEWETLDETLRECQEVRIPESIEKTDPTDLVEKAEWLLTFKDFSKIKCENLYVSMSPKKFIGLVSNKESVTPELIDLCTSAHVQAAISVSWILNKEVHASEGTLFIPQSMTHEWGHFIVEFEPFNYSTKSQVCHVLFLIHEEEPQSEDLATKIKLMKRVLDRVFPDIEKHITKEFIRFDEEMLISEVKDSALEQVGFDYPSLKFSGQMSPVAQTYSQEKFISRSLL